MRRCVVLILAAFWLSQAPAGAALILAIMPGEPPADSAEARVLAAEYERLIIPSPDQQGPAARAAIRSQIALYKSIEELRQSTNRHPVDVVVFLTWPTAYWRLEELEQGQRRLHREISLRFRRDCVFGSARRLAGFQAGGFVIAETENVVAIGDRLVMFSRRRIR